MRYGIKDKEGSGEQKQTIWLIDWKNPENNDFAIAEEVSIKGENTLIVDQREFYEGPHRRNTI